MTHQEYECFMYVFTQKIISLSIWRTLSWRHHVAWRKYT